MFCGMNFEGKTVVFGVSLLKEDNQESYEFACQSFFKSVDF
jgi:hypothetical protein